MKFLRSLLLLSLLVFSVGANAETRPNFVIIMADDLGYGDLSAYGGWIETPHLDALMRSGMKFTDFHSSGAVCSPTRAGLMTGRYQQRAGIPGVVYADPRRAEHTHGLQASEITFAARLKTAGYATGMFGKWHLGYLPKYNPVRHGFDEFIGYVSGNIDFFSHVDQAGALDWWQQDQLRDQPGYVTHLINRHSVDFIERNRDRPFCLYVPHEAPHYPYQGPSDEAFRKVGDAAVKQKLSPEISKRKYREMVQEMDQGVGEILATLAKHELSENTLVLFFSDNGATSLGSCGDLRGNKGSVWEGGHRVPCIASWPGRIPAGTTTDSPAISLDVMPTILSLAGIEPPPDRPLDGVDLSPVLFGGEATADRELYFEHGRQQAMRAGTWKLVRDANGKSASLYDLATDLGETNDVSTDHPERFERMNAALDAWKTDVTVGATPQP